MQHPNATKVVSRVLLVFLPMVLMTFTADAFASRSTGNATALQAPSGYDASRSRTPSNGSPPVEQPNIVEEFSPPAKKWDAGHRGVDLAASPKSQVRAIMDGEVRFAGDVAGKPVVSIDIGDGLTTTFEPVNAEVSRGDKVEEGEVVGTVSGNPMHCPDSCLHVGLREIAAERYFNPVRLWAQTPVTIVLLPVEKT